MQVFIFLTSSINFFYQQFNKNLNSRNNFHLFIITCSLDYYYIEFVY